MIIRLRESFNLNYVFICNQNKKNEIPSCRKKNLGLCVGTSVGVYSLINYALYAKSGWLDEVEMVFVIYLVRILPPGIQC